MVNFYYPSVLPLSFRIARADKESIVMFFFIFVITLANKSQVLGWPDIWYDDISDLPWFGEYPGYPGFSYPPYTGAPQLQNPMPARVGAGAQLLGNGGAIQHQEGHSIIIWPSVNGEPPRIEQRPGIVTHSTLSL
jgi:hypothetical protein